MSQALDDDDDIRGSSKWLQLVGHEFQSNLKLKSKKDEHYQSHLDSSCEVCECLYKNPWQFNKFQQLLRYLWINWCFHLYVVQAAKW